MTRTLFAFFDAVQVRWAHTHHRREMERPGTTLFAPGLAASSALEALGYANRRYRRLYRALDNKSIRDTARFFSRFWSAQPKIAAMAEAAGFDKYKGYPLPVMLHAHLRGWFAEAVLGATAMAELLNDVKPERVLCFDPDPFPFTYWHDPSLNLEPMALVSLARGMAVPVTRLPLPGAAAIAAADESGTGRSGVERPVAPPPWPEGRGRVLIVSHAYFYFDQFIPIMERLKADGFSVRVLLHEHLTPSQLGRLEALGIPWLLSIPYLEFARRRAVEGEAPDGAAMFAAMADDPEARAFFRTARGVPFWEVIQGRLRHLLTVDLPDCLQRIGAARMAMADLKPELVFSGLDQVSHDTPWVLAAEKEGARTLVYQHGIWNHDAVDQLTFASERICAMGPASHRQAVERFGLDERCVAATGYPLFDTLYAARRGSVSTETVRREIGLPPDRPVCLFLGAMGWVWGPDIRHSEAETLKCLLDLLDAMPQLSLVVRMHSGDQVEAMYPPLRQYGPRVLIDPGVTLGALLAAADVVLTQQTTAGLEAVCTGRPVVYLNVASERDTFPFATGGAAIGVYHPREVTAAVQSALDGLDDAAAARRERFLADQVHGPDGGAAGRMSRLCREMIDEGCNGKRGAAGNAWIARTALFRHGAVGLDDAWHRIMALETARYGYDGFEN